MGSGVSTNTGHGISFYNDLSGNVKLDGITIDNVNVNGFRNYGIAVGGWNQQSGFRNISVTNSSTFSNGKGGLMTYAQLGNTNENVYVGNVEAYNNSGIAGQSEPTGNGIYLGGVNGGTIERSIAYGNGALNNFSAGPAGIWTSDSTNIKIQYNESYNNRTGGRTDGDGFDLDQNVSNSVMQYNYSHGNDGAGFLLSHGPNNSNNNGNVVRFNVSENDGRKNFYAGIQLYGKITNAEIYNNTVFMDKATTGAPSAFYIYSPVNGVHFRNNIFQTKNGARVGYIAKGSTDLLFQGNNYYSSGSTFKILANGVNRTSLDNWRNATGQEKLNGVNTGFSVDPLLNNPGGGGTIGDANLLNTLSAYKLGSNSPALNQGLDLQSLFGLVPGIFDFYGNNLPIGSGFDIGANSF